MNAILISLVKGGFIVCGVILFIFGMDVGSSEHPTLIPGLITLGMAGGLNWMQKADKDWKKPIIHPLELIFSMAGLGVAFMGCMGLIGAVMDYFHPDRGLGNWLWSAMEACFGLLLARVGIAISK